MAPNVVDSNTVDSAEIAAHLATEVSKFAPLATGLFATPLPKNEEKNRENTESYWGWNEDDRTCKEKERLRQLIVEKEEIRQVLKADNVVDNLIKAAKDSQAESDKQYITADFTQESYWDEATEAAVDNDDEGSVLCGDRTVTKLENGLEKDAARRRKTATQPHHTNSHVGNESHSLANYWFWPSSESDKQALMRSQRNLIVRDIAEREEIRKQLSVFAIEASLVREAEDRENNKKKQVEGTCDDAYWAWNDKSVKANHDPSSWDAYWDFESTNRDAMVHEVMRHEEARQAVSVDRIESNLLRESKDVSIEESKGGEVTGCSDDDYWVWNDDHLVKSSRDPSSSDSYWNFGATERDVVVDRILAQEEARRAVEVGRLEHHLVQEGVDRRKKEKGAE